MKTYTFRAITSHADKDSLVITDINDTIGTLCKKMVKNEGGKKKTYREYQLIEKDTPEIIKNLQKNGICVMGLTMMSTKATERTSRRLLNLGIDLAIHCLRNNPIALPLPTPAVYFQGILFTGINPKGETLKSFLQQVAYIPKKIIFIDDNLTHIKSVEKAVKCVGAEFIGLHFLPRGLSSGGKT